MRRLLLGLAACFACADPPIAVTAPPLEVRVPVHECSVDGAACDPAGAMCPVPGICRAGACVPSKVGALASPHNGFGGNFFGAMRGDGAAYADSAYDPPAVYGFGPREETAQVAVQLVSGRVGVGVASDGQLSALDLDMRTVLWAVTLGPGRLGPGGLGTDTGRGLVAVIHGIATGSALSFVRLADGVVVASQPYVGPARGLVSDEEGRVFLRSGDAAACRIDAFTAGGEPLWTSDGTCDHRPLVTQAGRLFDGATVRDTATGDAVFELDPGFAVALATDEIIVATAGGILELRDPLTFARRLRQAGAGAPFAITSRGTILAAARDSIFIENCASDCTLNTGEIREYAFDGRLIGMCDAVTEHHLHRRRRAVDRLVESRDRRLRRLPRPRLRPRRARVGDDLRDAGGAAAAAVARNLPARVDRPAPHEAKPACPAGPGRQE